MGVNGLWKLLQPCGRIVPLEGLRDKVLAIDVSIWLYQAMHGMRGENQSPVAYLIILFHRLCKLLFYGIKPIFVFDGGVPALKRNTMRNRQMRKSAVKSEANRLRSKLMKNLLKHEALRHVLSDEATSSALGLASIALPGPGEEESLYKLPPSASQAISSTSSEEEDEEDDGSYFDIHSVDVESEAFRQLPADIRHDILCDLKDTRKQSSWRQLHDMPQQSQDFSDFQMNRLLKRRAVQVSLEECGKELSARDVSLGELESMLGDTIKDLGGEISSGRVAQDDTQRYVLVQKAKANIAGAEKRLAAENSKQKAPMETILKILSELEEDSNGSVKVEEKSGSGQQDSGVKCEFSTEEDPVQSMEVEVKKCVNVEEDAIQSIEKELLGDVAVVSSKEESSSQSNLKEKVKEDEVVEVENLSAVEDSIIKELSDDVEDAKDIAPVLKVKTESSDEIKEIVEKVATTANDLPIPSISADGRIKIEDADVISRKNTELYLNPSFDEPTPSDANETSAKLEAIPSSSSNKTSTIASSSSEVPNSQIQIPSKTETPVDSGEAAQTKLNKTQQILMQLRNQLKGMAENMEQDEDEIDLVGPSEESELPAIRLAEISDSKTQQSDRLNLGGPSEETELPVIRLAEISDPKTRLSDKHELDLVRQIEESELPAIRLSEISNPKSDGERTKGSKTSSVTLEEVRMPEKVNSPPESEKKAESVDLESDSSDDGDFMPVLDSPPTLILNSEIEERAQALLGVPGSSSEPSMAQLGVPGGSSEPEEPPLSIDDWDSLAADTAQLMSQHERMKGLAQSVSDQMFTDAQELLKLFGVPYIVAPMEAEAQCATLEALGLTNGTITDDSDIWLFGGSTVYKNFFDEKKHVLQYTSHDIQHFLKLDRNEMIRLALLVGSDYTPGLKGVGPVTAMEILAAFPTKRLEEPLHGLRQFQNWVRSGFEGPTRVQLKKKIQKSTIIPGFPSDEVFEAYVKPHVDSSDEKFSWGRPDLGILEKYTRLKFGWPADRCKQFIMPVMKKLLATSEQPRITKYFVNLPSTSRSNLDPIPKKPAKKRKLDSVQQRVPKSTPTPQGKKRVPPPKVIAETQRSALSDSDSDD